MHDLVIRNGLVVDGTGGPARTADVAVDDGRITVVGTVDANAEAAEVIDATGLMVTPGFVDIHTHYDGQVTWDPLLEPSSWHGVTTLVMGNCGVGFAPVFPEKREWLISLMEGVEDIPGTALHEGIKWAWESFPEFLDAVDSTPKALDVAAQVPHGAVRGYVMGERGARNEAATPDDIDAMARLVQEGLEAGAFGVTTSRTILHRAVDGEPVPGTFAAEDELFAFGRALAKVGHGVMELAPAGVQGEDMLAPDKEFSWMRRLAEETGRPITYVLVQHDVAPDDWKRLLDHVGEAFDHGTPIRPQVPGRPVSLLLGLDTMSPLSRHPSMLAIAHLPVEERVERMRDPKFRAQVLGEESTMQMPAYVSLALDRVFQLGDPPNYEPDPSTSIAAQAKRAGVAPEALLYDLLLEGGGHELLFRPLLGYSYFDLDALREMVVHPATLLGGGDGGAHVRSICDASIQTFMLTHWVRDRTRGARIPVEQVVNKMTAANADLYGFDDRGRVAVGKKADLNVIDAEHLHLHAPEFAHDLPGGAGRLVQRADGYVATIVSGEITRRNGVDTGARPGRLVRAS